MITEVIKSLFPPFCVLAVVVLAQLRPDAKELQVGILGIGATAYQPKGKNES